MNVYNTQELIVCLTLGSDKYKKQRERVWERTRDTKRLETFIFVMYYRVRRKYVCMSDQRIFTDTRNPRIVRRLFAHFVYSRSALRRGTYCRTHAPTPRAGAVKIEWKQKSNEFNFCSILFSVLTFAVRRAKLFCFCHISLLLHSAVGASFVWARACASVSLRNSK